MSTVVGDDRGYRNLPSECKSPVDNLSWKEEVVGSIPTILTNLLQRELDMAKRFIRDKQIEEAEKGKQPKSIAETYKEGPSPFKAAETKQESKEDELKRIQAEQEEALHRWEEKRAKDQLGR